MTGEWPGIRPPIGRKQYMGNGGEDGRCYYTKCPRRSGVISALLLSINYRGSHRTVWVTETEDRHLT
jgi:hypothetical protein